MPLEEKELMPPAIFEGCHKDYYRACVFTVICQLESQLKVRKWFPEVKQNMDIAGTHNDLLCQELWIEGLITDSKDWRKSKQWIIWRKLFQQRPDIGTMVSAKAFCRLADQIGLYKTVEVWKQGCINNVNGILRRMAVRSLTYEMCRRKAE